MRRCVALVGCTAASIATPAVAHAHLVNSGLGPVYDGALHLMMSPEDLLGVVAMGLLAGLRGACASRLAVLALPAGWLASGLVGSKLAEMPELPWVSALCLLCLGGLVALDCELPPWAVALLGGLFGVLHGLSNGAALAASGAGPTAILGIASAVAIIGLLLSAMVVSLRRAWARIAVRVAGSWVGAIGMLMLGWWVKSG